MLPRYNTQPKPWSSRTPTKRQRLQNLLNTARLRWRQILTVLLTFYIFTIYNRRKHPFSSKPHQITNSDIEYSLQHHLTTNFIPLSTSKTLCSSHKWPAYPHRTQPRKIYDLIMLNNELDWLEIRLETMSSQVSYFVILESSVTFTGLQKPLSLKENWARFEKWHKQIIYKVLENPPLDAKRTWDLEDYQRNAMLLQGVMGKEVGEEMRASEGDVIIVADVDEVIRPTALLLLRECDFPRRVTLRSRFFYYGFQWEHRGEQWAHPQATVFRGKKTILPADLRNGEGGNRLFGWWQKVDLWNSGWHCSSCFATVEDMLNKMQSFSHTSLNQEKFKDRTRIVDRVRKGLDLWDRDGEIYDRRENNNDIPEFLKGDEQRKNFAYLLNRDGSNAGFIDYGPGEDAGE